MERKQMKRQGGFTLIELITVIIILGILAAVIAPRYFDMADNAEQAALDGALSEGLARFNMAYAQFVLETNGAPTNLASMTGSSDIDFSASEDLGDYTITYGGGTGDAGSVTDVTVTATNDDDGTITKTVSFAWPE